MTRTGVRNRKRAHGIQFRGQTVEMEWTAAGRCHELFHRGYVARVVDARTGGICYIDGCTERIISYPHAVPMWEHGVHHPLNRAGVCLIHRESLDAGGRTGAQFRRMLQDWLTTWYAARGLPPERWLPLAGGQAPIPLEFDDCDEVRTGAV